MFENFTWLSAAWLLIPPIALEAWIRFGPKGRRTQSAAALIGLTGFVETSGLIDIIPADQWQVLMVATGYVVWRLRQVTTTPPGQK